MPPPVAIVTEIPTPYRQPVFELLARDRRIDCEFAFLANSQRDRFWDRALLPPIPATWFPGVQLCVKGYHTVHLNWGVTKWLKTRRFGTFVIAGYAQPALRTILKHCWTNDIPYVTWTESHMQKPRARWLLELKKRYVRNVYARAGSHLVAGSAAETYAMHYGAKTGTFFRFPNTVDGPLYGRQVDRQRDARKANRAFLGIRGEPVILYVGTLNRRKGVDVLLEAFASLANRFPAASLVLAGRGSLEASVRARALASGLSDRVTLPGFVQPSELPRVYAAADLFALPSREEPFGAVICEAMAAGLPVVTTAAVGAAADFVTDGKNGYVVPPGDGARLADALSRLLSDSRLRQSMGFRSAEVMKAWTHARLSATLIAAVGLAASTKKEAAR